MMFSASPPMDTAAHSVLNGTRRRMVWLACAVLFVGWAGLQWWFRPPPMIGGGEAPDARTQRALQEVYDSISPAEEVGWTRLDPDRPTGWLQSFAEPVQSLALYQTQNPMRPTRTRRTIVLQPLGTLNSEQKKMLPLLRDYAKAFVQLPVRVAPPLVMPASISRRVGNSPSPTFRQQFRAGDLIEVLQRRRPNDAAVYFGVAGVDLYADELNFVFGQAEFEQRIGVYSLARLFPEFWNKPRRVGDARQALRRACQVLNHEIGHVLGLSHCVFYKCSMNGSNSLGEADAAPIEFCPICRRKLLWNLNGDSANHYEAKRAADLQRFLKRHGLAVWRQNSYNGR